MRFFLILGTAMALAGLGPVAAPVGAQSYPYVLTDLDAAAVTTSRGASVNNTGQIAGTLLGGTGRAFLSGPGGGARQALPTLGGISYAQGNGVNDAGQVVGHAPSDTSGLRAFVSGPNGGPLTDLGSFGGYGSEALGINAQGQVTGYARFAGDSIQHAFLWSPGGLLMDLGTLGGNNSTGNAVNDLGQVTGQADLPGTGQYHAFLSGPGGGPLTDLGTSLSKRGGPTSVGTAVNHSGQVAGYGDLGNFTTHAFISSPNGGPLTDLGTLGGTNSYAYGMNDSGQVVGSFEKGFNHAFVVLSGTMYDLNTLIMPGSGLVLDSGKSISNTGFITGEGLFHNTSHTLLFHTFLLTPVVPPLASLAFASPIPGGTVLTATVTLSGMTPTDTVVGLSSSDPSTVRVFRAVVVPAGSSSATFTINTFRSHVTKTVTIQAALGSVVQAQNLTITGR